MKRDEHGREDVMREAVSLNERIEFRLPSTSEPIVLGLNQFGWLFVYIGSDPMYRFDHLGRLRRAFVDGFLFRTSGKSLARLDRRGVVDGPQSTESVLLRQDLSAQELDEFRLRMRFQIEELLKHLNPEAVTRHFPDEASNLVARFRDALGIVVNSGEFLAPAIVRR